LGYKNYNDSHSVAYNDIKSNDKYKSYDTKTQCHGRYVMAKMRICYADVRKNIYWHIY